MMHTLQLRHADLVIQLADDSPRVLRCEDVRAARRLSGEPLEREPEALICRLADRCYSWTRKAGWRALSAVRRGTRSAAYTVSVFDGPTAAVRFDLRFMAKKHGFELEFGKVWESPGYELMSVRTPALLSVGAYQPDASLVIPTHSGRRIPVAQCPPYEMVHPVDWFHPAPIGMVYHEGLVGILTVPSADDNLISSVVEMPDGRRFGCLAVQFAYRAHAAPPAPQFVVQQSSKCTVEFATDENGDGRCDWADGAIRWRAQIKARPSPAYRKTFIYKIMLDMPRMQDPTTFEEALEIIRRVNRLTDGSPQVVYLVGWQHQGHDSKYPDVFTVNERIGGMDGLRKLIAEAEKLNCTLSFHDNYDDAYTDSPAWDPDIIARDSAGELMRGYVWAGGQSYIIGAANYARGLGLDRVRRTLDTYPIKKTYHIDVLSAEICRYDFRADSPAGATENLRGKLRIIEEFNKRGVDVTSEGLTYPFVGHIGHAWHLHRGRDTVYPVEERIPLVPFLYQGTIGYGGGSASEPTLLDALLYGATFSGDFTKRTPDRTLTDNYYLLALPALALRELRMLRYDENGDTRVIHYQDDTRVEVNEREQTYRIVVRGRLIAKDFTSWIPYSPRKSLLYSRDDGVVAYPVPDGWLDAGAVRAFDLLAGRPADLEFRIESGEIRAQVRGGHPYRVEYSG